MKKILLMIFILSLPISSFSQSLIKKEINKMDSQIRQASDKIVKCFKDLNEDISKMNASEDDKDCFKTYISAALDTVCKEEAVIKAYTEQEKSSNQDYNLEKEFVELKKDRQIIAVGDSILSFSLALHNAGAAVVTQSPKEKAYDNTVTGAKIGAGVGATAGTAITIGIISNTANVIPLNAVIGTIIGAAVGATAGVVLGIAGTFAVSTVGVAWAKEEGDRLKQQRERARAIVNYFTGTDDPCAI